MDALFDASLGTGGTILLFACLFIALGFEFVNGFHDTANAVATVIYTKSLRPQIAVLISGVCNFLGVFAGGIGVAMGIIKLLPVELLVASGPGAGLAMVLALLLSAITWNLGTWYLGLPSSSSHTLIGSILGVGLANSMLPGHVFGDGVNWHKAQEIGLSRLISPLVGFGLSFLLFVAIARLGSPRLLEAPTGEEPPPPTTRAVLVATCSAVSFAHGSNDGQKGVGLVMLILIGLLPGAFALNTQASDAALQQMAQSTVQIEALLDAGGDASTAAQADLALAHTRLADLRTRVAERAHVTDIPEQERFSIREDVLLADKAVSHLLESGHLRLDSAQQTELQAARTELRAVTEYAPTWVLVAIALSLGLGTMIGWQRIVVTVGEKIGKSHLTYAQGMSAELVAALAIGLASVSGLPVSTTHVLSSGVAGTMVAQSSGLNPKTVRNIALAWVLTLPVSVVLSGGMFLLFRLAVG